MLNNSHLITETIKPLLPTSLGQDTSNKPTTFCDSNNPKSKCGKRKVGKKDVCHIDINILEWDEFADDSEEKSKKEQPKQKVKTRK